MSSCASRPPSAGFVGAFRAAVKPRSLRIRPTGERTPLCRPCSAPNLHITICEQAQSAAALRPVSATRSAHTHVEAPRKPCQLGRPASAPFLCRSGHEQAKECSEWDILAKHQARIHRQSQVARVCKQHELKEEERRDMTAHFAEQARMKSVARRRRDADHKNMERLSREYRQEQRRELLDARNQSLEAKVMIQSQMLQGKQRRASERTQQLREDEASRRECAQLVAEEKAEKAAREEARLQEMLQTSKHLEQQTRLKKLAVKERQEEEIRVVKEYKELCERQDAARAAQLQARVDDQARRMAALADGVKEKEVVDQAMIARIDRHWKEKYTADEEKFKRETLERHRLLQECNTQRNQQIEHDEHLLKLRHAEDHHFMSILERQHMEAVAKDKNEAATKKVQRKQNQHVVVAQIAEKKARVPVDMTQIEREFNMAALTLGESHGPASWY